MQTNAPLPLETQPIFTSLRFSLSLECQRASSEVKCPAIPLIYIRTILMMNFNISLCELSQSARGRARAQEAPHLNLFYAPRSCFEYVFWCSWAALPCCRKHTFLLSPASHWHPGRRAHLLGTRLFAQVLTAARSQQSVPRPEFPRDCSAKM